MCKKILFIGLLIVFLAGNVMAQELITTNSDLSFRSNESVTVVLNIDQIPNLSGLDGQVEIAEGNAEIANITTDASNKKVASNLAIDPKRFILYELNNAVNDGKVAIEIMPLSREKIILRVKNLHGATPLAMPIEVQDAEFILLNTYDFDKDGIVSGDDIVFMVHEFLNDTGILLTAPQLQQLINDILGLS